jgi:RhoGEF domain
VVGTLFPSCRLVLSQHVCFGVSPSLSFFFPIPHSYLNLNPDLSQLGLSRSLENRVFLIFSCASPHFVLHVFAHALNLSHVHTHTRAHAKLTLPILLTLTLTLHSLTLTRSLTRRVRACVTHPAISESLTLQNLLIAPVQRIPRYILLLCDLCKHTAPTHPDFAVRVPLIPRFHGGSDHAISDHERV